MWSLTIYHRSRDVVTSSDGLPGDPVTVDARIICAGHLPDWLAIIIYGPAFFCSADKLAPNISREMIDASRTFIYSQPASLLILPALPACSFTSQ